jgi:uncharacterized RDD family membrane protein YckC
LTAPRVPSRGSRRRAAAAVVVPRGEIEIGESPREPALPARPAYQPSLFTGPDASKIVPIRPRADGRPRSGRGAGPRATVAGPFRYQQQTLRLGEFSAAALSPAAAGMVCCDARVAGVAHRLLAAAADLALVAIAVGPVLVGLFAWGGLPLTGRPAAIFCGAAFLTVWTLYQLLWCTANLDSTGTRWMHLRLVDFNGYPPRRRERLIRLGVMCLGTLAAGLGLAWALVDEEGLTWQDHVSQTFPTPD